MLGTCAVLASTLALPRPWLKLRAVAVVSLALLSASCTHMNNGATVNAIAELKSDRDAWHQMAKEAGLELAACGDAATKLGADAAPATLAQALAGKSAKSPGDLSNFWNTTKPGYDAAWCRHLPKRCCDWLGEAETSKCTQYIKGCQQCP
jgi:hypothetical protein